MDTEKAFESENLLMLSVQIDCEQSQRKPLIIGMEIMLWLYWKSVFRLHTMEQKCFVLQMMGICNDIIIIIMFRLKYFKYPYILAPHRQN